MRPRVLFVCVENSCRSQMAEGFARMAGAEAHSAGSRPSGTVDPGAVAVMAELGCDLAGHRSKGTDDVPPGDYDAVVTMGCGEACPALPTKRREEWPIPDPKGTAIEGFRKVRDEIGTRVRALLGELTRSGRGDP